MKLGTSCQACITSSLNGDFEACNVPCHCHLPFSWAMTKACFCMVCWIMDFRKFRRPENKFDPLRSCAAFCFQTGYQIFTEKRVDYFYILVKNSSRNVQPSCFSLKQTKAKSIISWQSEGTEKALTSSLSLLLVAKGHRSEKGKENYQRQFMIITFGAVRAQ